MSWELFGLVLGAAARLTRVVTADTITGPLRAAVIRRIGVDSYLAEFVGCPWCVGFWMAAGVAALAWASGGAAWFVWPAAALAVSQLIGIAAQWV